MFGSGEVDAPEHVRSWRKGVKKLEEKHISELILKFGMLADPKNAILSFVIYYICIDVTFHRT